MKELRIESVNISERKGTIKKPVAQIQVGNTGLEGDSHSGDWNRMVSLLSLESIREFEQKLGRSIKPGEFAENLTVSGMVLSETAPLDRLIFGDVVMEVTQIGKKCHGSACAIYKQAGDCVMPREGIFARVLNSGMLRPGVPGKWHPKTFRVQVITLSDRASAGVYEDRSGLVIGERICDFFAGIGRRREVQRTVIPDDAYTLEPLLIESAARCDMVFTTGGTGIGPRDITPDVIRPLLDREIPGIMEMIRVKYGADKPSALISRSVAGVLGKCLVFALPGSVKAVEEYMTEILKVLEHLVYMLHNIDTH